MFDTLLLPVDMSRTNEHVLRRARDLATPDHTRVVLLHVIETLQDEEPGEMDDFYEELRVEAEEKMEGWATPLVESNFDVETVIAYGQRGPEIIRMAEDEDADLVVLRSRILDRDDEDATVGTVSHQVAVFAPCSVHLVRVASTG